MYIIATLLCNYASYAITARNHKFGRQAQSGICESDDENGYNYYGKEFN